MEPLLKRLGIRDTNSGVCCGDWVDPPGSTAITSINPATAEPIATVATGSREDYDRCVAAAQRSFACWRTTPPPQRGEIVRQLGQLLREHKRDLGRLVTLETGKILSEGEGEVQEMIDICDFATGLSRQLYGLTIASERPRHRLFEQWHPLGAIGVITAFNFPVAVWAWNAVIAAVCGNTMIWKPSPTTPLTAIAVQSLVNRVTAEHKFEGVFNLCIGSEVGRWMAEDRRLPLISATGSCKMGRSVAQTVGARLGRTLLELGGNNGLIVTESANLDLALRAILFAAVGTAGQRCTTLRRLIIHESIAATLIDRLVAAYRSIPVGNPLDDGVLVGPLINESAVAQMLEALAAARQQGGDVLCG
ncbi:MAG: aldehyde dehydrogenase family protein, partial [Acidobacteria bacterium]|nr:aldehyde dehydrogenase family protein [Acidobacteriota bacterium]